MSLQTEKPEYFDNYWDEVDDELAGYPARPEIKPMPRHSTEDFTVYWLKLTSLGPYRIGGYYSVPSGSGPFPAVMNTPRYGSVDHVPHYNDRLRDAVLTLMHRGQRLTDQPFAASYPGLLTLGIDDPETYIYRSIVADCLRGAEFLASRSEVDQQRIAINGDDLALITAARRSVFSVVQATGLTFYRLDEARRQSSAYPIEEINDHLRTHPEKEAQVRRTLSYFDPLHHVSGVAARTVLSVNDPGSQGGPEWMEPLMEAHRGQLDPYQITHEGGTDHDRLDAWMAEQLGVSSMTQFQRTYR